MKGKTKIIIAVIVLILIALAWWFFVANKKAMSPAELLSNGAGDLFAQNVSMTCTYTDEEGREATTYIKHGAVRSDYTGKTDQESGSMILKDKMMYTWQGKEGMKMTIPDVSVTPSEESTQPAQESATQQEELKAEIERYKESCKNSVLSDDLFTPPADVTFTDYSEMMQQSQQMMQQGSGMNEEQIKEYMQQYSPAQ